MVISISTHALREEGDATYGADVSDVPTFLPTPSARRATINVQTAFGISYVISTHALREEGDSKCAGK